jgi:hypothetical protein
VSLSIRPESPTSMLWEPHISYSAIIFCFIWTIVCSKLYEVCVCYVVVVTLMKWVPYVPTYMTPPFFFFVIRARSICPRCTTAYRLIVQSLSPPVIFRCSYFCRQVPPCLYDARDPSSERWNCGWECWPVILPKYWLPCFI